MSEKLNKAITEAQASLSEERKHLGPALFKDLTNMVESTSVACTIEGLRNVLEKLFKNTEDQTGENDGMNEILQLLEHAEKIALENFQDN